MGSESHQRDAQRAREDIARLQRRKSDFANKVADELKRAAEDDNAAARSSSSSARLSRGKDAQRHRENAATAQKQVASVEVEIGREQAQLAEAERRFASARADEDKRRWQDEERAAKARADEEKRRREKEDRAAKDRERNAAEDQCRQAFEHDYKMSLIAETLHVHRKLHSVALSAIESLQRLPEKITVLFLASNPVDQDHLRLDEEARSVAEKVRASKHRDAVRLESRWAVRPGDLLQAINETSPRVIHFSGHGSEQDEIVFQDERGRSKPVSKKAIVELLAATSGDIQLVFFNTCHSRGQAEAAVEHIPAAIGMNTSIGDAAARVFSAAFYSAIGFGLSVDLAFKQAKVALMLEGIPEADTPELFVNSDLNGADLILVKPPAV